MSSTKIFYAWQSDLSAETNRNAIRKSLEKVTQAFADADITTLEIDEATRDEAGSPNIPSTILKKISNSDIFICDITTINSDSEDDRKTPNPNVVFELGYAVSELGWERILLLFNTGYGKFSELPFDFDRHRVSGYELTDKNADLKPLVGLLKVAIKSIAIKNPSRPSELRGMSPEEKRKEIDVSNLRWLLSTFHVPSLEEFINDPSLNMRQEIMFFWEEFDRICRSSLFHIYNRTLANTIKALHKNWDIASSHGELYFTHKSYKGYILQLPIERPLSVELQKQIDEIARARINMGKALKKLQKIVREEYLELNPMELSQQAIKDYRLYYGELA